MRHVVILAGGSGTRLWPASRRSRPKQFLALGGSTDESLIAATARRVAGNSVWVVTAADQVPLVRAALPALPADAVVAEPCGRNTAAALGLAAVHLCHRDPDAIMGALPADQHIADEDAFARVANEAFALAERDDVIVTVGIVPTHAETGFGYLQLGARLAGNARDVARFVEKPDRATAEQYLASGDYLWNGGMFFVRARRLLDDIARLMPDTAEVLDAIASALERSPEEAERVTAERYPTVPKVSIDYGVMEKASGVVTIPGDFGWSDVGSWTALADYRPTDAGGNVIQGNAVLCDAAGNVVVSDPDCAVALVGVHDLVVVQSGDAVLVVPRARAQEVRDAVAALDAAGLERFR